mmetsp:Transcript_1286/g.1432  ORF Transcript_1286/g.1432 Transcript_1286/m.1432 type:complete len:119 (-) Transcript_1286:1-357(-)
MASAIVRLATEKGSRLYKDKQYAPAIIEYTTAIENAENDDEIHLYYSNRCACYLQLNKYLLAKDDAESCTRLKPTFTKGHSRLATCLLKLNKVQEAVYVLERAILLGYIIVGLFLLYL